MMKCEHCGKNEATFFVKSNINGKVTQVRLCQSCAQKLGYADQLRTEFRRPSFFEDDFFLHPFSMLEPFFGEMGKRMLTEFPDPTERPAQTAAAEPAVHLVSEEEQAKLQLQCRRNALEAQLKDAIAREDFESAIQLRDELKTLPANPA